jgi:hypothetical protein
MKCTMDFEKSGTTPLFVVSVDVNMYKLQHNDTRKSEHALQELLI